MRRLAAILSACLVASPALAGEPDGPPCFTATAAMANVAQHPDALAARLDGEDAQALLDRINAVGEPTSYSARTVIVVLHEDRAIVALFTPCHADDVSVDLGTFAGVWRAVRGRST